LGWGVVGEWGDGGGVGGSPRRDRVWEMARTSRFVKVRQGSSGFVRVEVSVRIGCGRWRERQGSLRFVKVRQGRGGRQGGYGQ
jgi:hypothetical protein